jgi:hypothetical protein
MLELVTVVITSCGRWDLLEKTLYSFTACNTYPIDRYILIEDSGKAEMKDKIMEKYPFIDVVLNEVPIGQIASIDTAYQMVTTPYIFHLEDDWHFHTEGDFIKESIDILESMVRIKVNPKYWLKMIRQFSMPLVSCILPDQCFYFIVVAHYLHCRT